MVNAFSKQVRDNVLAGGFIECKDIHDGSCEYEAALRFWNVFKLAVKFYFPIHLVPILIFKGKRITKEPGKVLKSFVKGFMRSVVMLSMYCMIFRYGLCQTKNRRHTVDRLNPIVAGFLATFSILWEP